MCVNIGSWDDVKRALEKYPDDSISCLILSGHGCKGCGVSVKGEDDAGRLNEVTLADPANAEVVRMIKAKVKQNGDIVISACESGDNPKAVKKLVRLLQRDVSVTTGNTKAVWPRIGSEAQGGYAYEGWIRYKRDFEEGWPESKEEREARLRGGAP